MCLTLKTENKIEKKKITEKQKMILSNLVSV